MLPGAATAADEALMRQAMDLAQVSGEAGDVPVGAIVAFGGQVVGSGANARESTGDPTAHAEVLALRAAARARGSWRLEGAALYVTLEPCPMCAGALVMARLSRLVFAAADPKAGSCGSLYNLCSDPRLNHEVEVVSGVLAAEAAGMLSSWFARRRGAPAP